MKSFGRLECFVFVFATFLTITVQMPSHELDEKILSAVANCSATYNIPEEKLQTFPRILDLVITRNEKCFLACIGSHFNLFQGNKLDTSVGDALFNEINDLDNNYVHQLYKRVKGECSDAMKSHDICEGVYEFIRCSVITVLIHQVPNPEIRRQTIISFENCSLYYGVSFGKVQRMLFLQDHPTTRNETCIPACLASNLNLIDKDHNKYNFTASDKFVEQLFDSDQRLMGDYQALKKPCQDAMKSRDLCDGVYELFQCFEAQVIVKYDVQIKNSTDYDELS